VGDALVQLGVRAIPLGIAAMLLGFVLKSAGTQAGPAAPGLPGPRVSAFGTIHPELFRFSTPLGSGFPHDRIRLASLEPQVGFDVPANGWGMLTDTSACRNALFDERFAALDDCPASFDNRFASDDDRQSSFNESLASAMEVLANSLRLPPDREVQKKRADAPPKAIVSKVDVRLAQPRKEAPPLEDDGRAAGKDPLNFLVDLYLEKKQFASR
jgi:hypothetical protein